MSFDNQELNIETEKVGLKDSFFALYKNLMQTHPAISFIANLFIAFTILSFCVLLFIPSEKKELVEKKPDKVVEEIVEIKEEEIKKESKSLVKDAIYTSYTILDKKNELNIFNSQLSLLSHEFNNKNFILNNVELNKKINSATKINIVDNVTMISSNIDKNIYVNNYIKLLTNLKKQSELSIANLSNNINKMNSDSKEITREISQKNDIIKKEKNNIQLIESSIKELHKNNVELSVLKSKQKIAKNILKDLKKSTKYLYARLDGVEANKYAIIHGIKVKVIKDMNIDIVEGNHRENSRTEKVKSPISRSYNNYGSSFTIPSPFGKTLPTNSVINTENTLAQGIKAGKMMNEFSNFKSPANLTDSFTGLFSGLKYVTN